jgi:hypothetical protein
MEFALADRLHRTVAELREAMSYEEFLGWIAFYRIKKREMGES